MKTYTKLGVLIPSSWLFHRETIRCASIHRRRFIAQHFHRVTVY